MNITEAETIKQYQTNSNMNIITQAKAIRSKNKEIAIVANPLLRNKSMLKKDNT